MDGSKAAAARSAISSSRCIVASDEQLWSLIPPDPHQPSTVAEAETPPKRSSISLSAAVVAQLNELEDEIVAAMEARPPGQPQSSLPISGKGEDSVRVDQRLESILTHSQTIKKELIGLGDLLEELAAADKKHTEDAALAALVLGTDPSEAIHMHLNVFWNEARQLQEIFKS